MRITLDTNILVSAFISKLGQPGAVLDLALTFEEIQLVLSERILDEFRDVLSRQEVKERFDYSSSDIEGFIKAVREASVIVKTSSVLRVVGEDPKDDIVVNTAYDGKSDYIVSGDHHLLKVKSFRGRRIVSARAMLRIFQRKFGEEILKEL